MLTEEELSTVPMTTELVPVVDPKDPDVFGVLFRFPTGRNQVWHLTAPKTPIDEAWIKAAIAAVLKQIMGDLRYGWSEPKWKRDTAAFAKTNWESVTGALHRLLSEWAKTRTAHYRAMASPEARQ
jgi:hypothetical protein